MEGPNKKKFLKNILFGAAMTAATSLYSQNENKGDVVKNTNINDNNIELTDSIKQEVDSTKFIVDQKSNIEKLDKDFIKPEVINDFVDIKEALNMSAKFDSFIIERWSGYNWTFKSLNMIDLVKYPKGWYRLSGKIIDSENNVKSEILYFSKGIEK